MGAHKRFTELCAIILFTKIEITVVHFCYFLNATSTSFIYPSKIFSNHVLFNTSISVTKHQVLSKKIQNCLWKWWSSMTSIDVMQFGVSKDTLSFSLINTGTYQLWTSFTEGVLKSCVGSKLISFMIFANLTGTSFRKNSKDVFSQALLDPVNIQENWQT